MRVCKVQSQAGKALGPPKTTRNAPEKPQQAAERRARAEAAEARGPTQLRMGFFRAIGFGFRGFRGFRGIRGFRGFRGFMVFMGFAGFRGFRGFLVGCKGLLRLLRVSGLQGVARSLVAGASESS